MTQQGQLKEAKIYKASSSDLKKAYSIVQQYCEEINATVRENEQEFGKYFEKASGVWLAQVDDQLVGCIAVRPLPQIENSCEVKRLYVKQPYRGQGIAEQLLQSLHQYAASENYLWSYLDTKDDLQAAIKFYIRNGYEHCERYNDNPQATIFMRRKL